MTTLFELGAEVARLRKAQGLTQNQLAKRAGLGLSTVARFETGGVAEFGTRKLLRLLDVLGYQMHFTHEEGRPTLDTVLAEKTRGV